MRALACASIADCCNPDEQSVERHLTRLVCPCQSRVRSSVQSRSTKVNCTRTPNEQRVVGVTRGRALISDAWQGLPKGTNAARNTSNMRKTKSDVHLLGKAGWDLPSRTPSRYHVSSVLRADSNASIGAESFALLCQPANLPGRPAKLTSGLPKHSLSCMFMLQHWLVEDQLVGVHRAARQRYRGFATSVQW